VAEMKGWAVLAETLAPWVAPAELSGFADACAGWGLDARELLAGLAAQYGATSRMGRACHVLADFRGADGARYRVSEKVIQGAVRFMFEGQREDNTEEDLEELLRNMLLPCPHPDEAEERAETMLSFIAEATSGEVVQGLARFGKMMKAAEQAGDKP
jgi:hypothetical protein